MGKREDAAKMLGGVFKEITVLVSRKRTDGNYGSYDVSYGATINVPDATTDVEELASALDAYLTASVAESMKQKQEALGALETVVRNAPQQPPLADLTPDEAPKTPLQVKPDLREPERVPIDDGGNEYDIFDVDEIVMQATPNGKLFGKAKGGKWTKWGVSVWEELLTAPPLEWDFDSLSVGVAYAAPVGLRAKALLNDKGQPSKVVEWL